VLKTLASTRKFWWGYRDLLERQRLLQRPWEEEFLHWSSEGQLHGHLPPAGRSHSTTSSGWCPGQPHQTFRNVVSRTVAS